MVDDTRAAHSKLTKDDKMTVSAATDVLVLLLDPYRLCFVSLQDQPLIVEKLPSFDAIEAIR